MVADGSQAAFSAQQLAYAYIRDRIRSGALRSGARVIPEEIAIELSISRMPVREAIRQLDSEGLVRIRPNRGAVVTELSPDDVMELFEMRAALESLAASKAAEHFDDDLDDRLSLILRRFGRSSDNLDGFIQQHQAFHAAISQQGGRQRLAGEIERLHAAVEPYLRLHYAHHINARFTIEEHVALLEALRSRDVSRAESVMRQHILSTAPELIEFLRSQPAHR